MTIFVLHNALYVHVLFDGYTNMITRVKVVCFGVLPSFDSEVNCIAGASVPVDKTERYYNYTQNN